MGTPVYARCSEQSSSHGVCPSYRLLPQNPNDEPASVLLERIRTERAEREMQPKTRKVAKRRAVKEPA